MSRVPIASLALVAAALVVAPPTGQAGSSGDRIAADERVVELAAELGAAIAGRDPRREDVAIGALGEYGGTEVADVFARVFSSARAVLHEARRTEIATAYELSRKLEVLAIIELRRTHQPALEDRILQLDAELEQLEATVTQTRALIERKARLCERLVSAETALFDGFDKRARRTAERSLQELSDAEGYGPSRFGAIELLGLVGSTETASSLVKRVIAIEVDRDALVRALSKFEKEAVRLKERLDRASARGFVDEAMRAKYVEARRRAERSQDTHLASGRLAHVATEAAGRCISRLDRSGQEKLLSLVTQKRRGAPRALQFRFFDVLRAAEGELVAGTLHAMLAAERDALYRAELIDALAVRRDARLEAVLRADYLADDSLHVKSRAAAALAEQRSKAAIPDLIERLEVEPPGRIRTDLAAALVSLTGRSFGTRSDLWRTWWAEHGGDFVVSDFAAEPDGMMSTEERVGATLFGIRTESQHSVYLLDLSGSMNHAMIARTNPTDVPWMPVDFPEEGEDSRLDVAKRELVRALGGIRDGGTFNILTYGGSVRAWRDEMVEMTPETRRDATAYVEGLRARGPTNLFAAFQRAFELAGIPGRGEWKDPTFDTLYLLSDGRASVGVMTGTPELAAYITERNRSAGITIHTIGLSGAQDTVLLQSLAERSGGAFVAR